MVESLIVGDERQKGGKDGSVMLSTRAQGNVPLSNHDG